MKRRLICLFLSLILSLALLPTTVLADLTTEPIKVRVGFFEQSGYHMIDNDGMRSGYGYDVLQLMARYENFVYEYVGYEKSFDEALNMLKKGEIDILTCVVKSPERMDQFEFSDVSLGHTSTNLTIKSDNTHFVVGDHATYDGMKVGMLHNAYRNYGFEEHAMSEGVHFSPVYFDHTSSMAIALQNKKIDAIVTSSLRAFDSNERLIESFNETPFYIASTKGNTELMDRINHALAHMDRYEGNWRLNLNEKYYKIPYDYLHLEADEYNYINQLQAQEEPLRVLVNPDRYPYSYFEDGHAKGILVDMFAQIAARIHLPYEIIHVKDREEYINYIRSAQADIYLDGLDTASAAEKFGYKITDPYLSTNFSLLMNKSTAASDIIRRAALVKYSSIGTSGYDVLSENMEYITYDSHDDCLSALKNGEVDVYCTYDYSAERILFEDDKGDLVSRQSAATIDFTLGVSQNQNIHLVALLNKSLKSIPQSTVNEIIYNNTNWGTPPITFTRLLYKYPAFTTLICLICVMLVFTIAFILFQRRQQKLLRKAVQTADAANRSKSEFLSQMSHDIRTPINGLMGMIELAQRNLDDPEKVSQYLHKMHGASSHLALLVNDILDISKLEDEAEKQQISVAPFHLPTLLDECTSIVEGRTIGRNLDLITEIGPFEHPDVVASKIYISRVIINILGNAVKYTKDGGKIWLRAQEESFDEEDGVAAYVFSVQDTGIGMTEEFKLHLFEAFAQADTGSIGLFQGTGLGMTIAKRLVDRMGGILYVESELGVGSTFTVTLLLPVSTESVSHQKHYVEPVQAPTALNTPTAPVIPTSVTVCTEKEGVIQHSQRPLHILVAEDVELNQEFVMSILEDEGILVTIAEDGSKAVELFRASPPETYDLIFMDIRMPVMDGHQATEAIRNMSDRPDGKTIPIVAMSANAYTEDIERSKAVGMNAHLSKPIKAIEILQAVEDYAKSLNPT